MNRIVCFAGMAATVALASCSVPPAAVPAASQLVRLDIVGRSPAFGGASFGDVGQYEVVKAVAHLRLDPAHPNNRQIADIDLAPRQEGGVRYEVDVVLLRPVNAAKASRVLVVELPNRGGRVFSSMANEGTGNVAAPGDAGNGYLMRQGHTLAWIGWQGDVALSGDGSRFGASLPALQQDGAPVTGTSYAATAFDNEQPTGVLRLTYPAATLDQARATLTVRAHARAPAAVIPATQWRYTSADAVEITRPKSADAGALYQLDYTATGAKAMGLGLAALRDTASYLKHAQGAAHPLADIKPDLAIAVGVSQSGRVLRDFLWQGFNQDLDGRRVFDGAMPLIAGSRKSFLNVRFAQPGRFSTQHTDHLTYGDQFPFSYANTTDPVSGRSDGIFKRCAATRTCPRLMHLDSSLEFWQARAALLVSDGAGHAVALPDDVRAYLLSSTQHQSAGTPSRGICKYPSNPASQAPAVRALFAHLVAWSRSGTPPPPSRYPDLSSGTLARPERNAAGFPDLSGIGIEFPDVVNQLDLVDYTRIPGTPVAGKSYQVLVPKTDADGLDMAGIRLPDVAVPLATYTGWNLRRSPYAENQLCGLSGMSALLPATADARDPRRPLAARYRSRSAYVQQVTQAAQALREAGYLLEEDVTRYVELAGRETRIAQ